MALTKEQIAEVKKQLYTQVEHLPEEQKGEARIQIESLSEQAVESLIQQQKSRHSNSEENKSIFRMIVDKEVSSLIFKENKKALAVLDINPISRGHLMIIPKEAVKKLSEIPAEVYNLAKESVKTLIKAFKPEKVSIETEAKFGEIILHVLPSYENPVSLSSPRQKSTMPELEEILSKIKPKEKKKIIRIKQKTQKYESLKLNRRIP
ncbi:MAG: HIT family protein [Nanoarchaeota archaeon]